jgi:rare lipoprotein A
MQYSETKRKTGQYSSPGLAESDPDQPYATRAHGSNPPVTPRIQLMHETAKRVITSAATEAARPGIRKFRRFLQNLIQLSCRSAPLFHPGLFNVAFDLYFRHTIFYHSFLSQRPGGMRNPGRSLIIRGILLLLLASPAAAQVGFTQTGIASYYGADFHGKKTSSGEIYNMWALTAAHKSIPLQTLVRVTNLENKLSVVVRINDHGPHVKGRIIDLSRGAAAKIGMIRKGTARVRLEVIEADTRPDFAKEKGNTEFYSVSTKRVDVRGFGIQLASFQHMANLIQFTERLKKAGISDSYVQVATVAGKVVHRVVLGGYESKEAADWKLRTLKQQGIDGFVFRIPE